MSRLIYESIPNAKSLLALSRRELAANLLEHLHAVGGNPLKQQYSHPENLAISIKGHYPLPFRDNIQTATFSACKWLINKEYLIETNNQGFFEITEEGNRIRIAADMIGSRSVVMKANGPSETSESTSKVFISHSWEDKPLVQQLEIELRSMGAEVWVDHRGIRGGDSLPEEISNALQWCNTLLLLWSKASSKSYWVKLEWENALTLKKAIIPCLIDEVELPPILSHKAYVKFVDVEEGIRQLLNSLKRTKRTVGPSIPVDPEIDKDPRKKPQRFGDSPTLSSTQVKIMSLLLDEPLTRSQISGRLISLFGSETRPAMKDRALEHLIQQNLVEELQLRDSESTLTATSKGRQLLLEYEASRSIHREIGEPTR